MAKDFYTTLGVARDASADDIKRAYRKLARENHPDLHPNDKKAEQRFKEVQEAYEILSDEEKRAQFDRFGSAAFEQGFPGGAGGPRTYTWSGSRGAGPAEFEFGGMGGIDDLVQNLFGARGRQRGGRRQTGFGYGQERGRDHETELAVPLKTALLGGEMEINVFGTKSERLSIKIPPGVEDGARLRLAGKGEAAPGGGEPGDLIVLVRVQSHPYFTRDGNDVIVDVPVTLEEAVLGAQIDVPTLDGTISLAIPPGTSSGKRLRLRGKGAKSKTGERGDQYVRLKIVVPAQVDEASQKLIRDFAKRNPLSPRNFPEA
jgi:DnaJ-class molecular chaperone